MLYRHPSQPAGCGRRKSEGLEERGKRGVLLSQPHDRSTGARPLSLQHMAAFTHTDTQTYNTSVALHTQVCFSKAN